MSEEPIAIVGASCRFPGADGLEAYWRLLIGGGDAVTAVDSQRWSTRLYYHPRRTELGKSYSWAAGLIDGMDLFEPAFFGISPREAAQMDPQQRLMLELAWHALEDAGIPTEKLASSEIGVYVGASSTDYRDIRAGDPSSGDSYSMTGGTLSIIANRVSYLFDLRGPSFAVDTACSSSLVALHQACEAIRAGRIAGRARRRRQHSAVAVFVRRVLPRRDAVADRALPRLRRARRRLCAQRGLRGRLAEADGAGLGGRRPGPRRDPRHWRQFRRAHDRPVLA